MMSHSRYEQDGMSHSYFQSFVAHSLSSAFLNASGVGAETVASHSSFQGLTTLLVKKLFLALVLTDCLNSFFECPLVHCGGPGWMGRILAYDEFSNLRVIIMSLRLRLYTRVGRLRAHKRS